MILTFPSLPGGLSILNPILDTVRRALSNVVTQDQAVDHILLLSPSGKTYTIQVSDLGVVTATVNDGKTRP